MKPSVGQIVHYCATGKEPPVYPSCSHFDAFERKTANSNHPDIMKEGESFTAVVTCTFMDRDDVTATVSLPGGGLLSVRCPYAESPTPGHWSRLPRV